MKSLWGGSGFKQSLTARFVGDSLHCIGLSDHLIMMQECLGCVGSETALLAHSTALPAFSNIAAAVVGKTAGQTRNQTGTETE